MKLMIASDLHGSAYYVNLLCERMKAEAPERLVLLGDLLYHGPRNGIPRGYDTPKVADMLNAITPRPICIRGNCDGEVDQMVLDFPMLEEQGVLFADGRCFFLTHGHHLEEAARRLTGGDVIFYGHTHLPDFTLRDGIYYVNPGSVSCPKDGTAHSYLICEHAALTCKDVETGEPLRTQTI